MSPRERLAAAVAAAGPRLGRLLISPYVVGTELPHLAGDTIAPLSFGHDPLGDYRSELIATLGAFRWRLWLNRSLVLVLRAVLLAAGLLVAVGLLEFAGLVREPWWPGYLAGLALLGGGFLVLRQHLSYFDVARVVDRHLGLKAQLGTAVELTQEWELGQLARSQIRQATTIARRLQPGQAVAFRMPWADLRLLTLVLAVSGALALLGSLGPAPGDAERASRLDRLDPEMSYWYEIDPAMAQYMTPPEDQPTGLQALIDNLRRQLSKNEISPTDYASMIAEVEDQLREQVAESSRQQAALAELAAALGDSSSTRSVAESLNRGDYAQAVQELADLAAKADRLSSQARQELAERLAEAAEQTAGVSPELSAAAQQAAEALRQGDQAGAQQALRDLANAIANASQAVAPQSELGETLRQLQEAGFEDELGFGEGEGESFDPANGGGFGEQAGMPGAEGEPGAQGSSRSSTTSAEGQGRGTGAGTGRGERIVPLDGSQNPSAKPNPSDNVLRITGRASGEGTRVRGEPPGNVPLTSSSSGTATIQGGSGPRSGEVVNALAESNYVPLEMRPVVKDYFSSSERP